MIFPIGDDQVSGGYKPFVSYSLIALNIAVFIFQLAQGEHINDFVNTYAAIPAEIDSGIDLYTLVTSLFLHGGFMHLIGNLMFLWVFADNIEATIGNIPFLIFYLICGILATLIHCLMSWGSEIPCIGASGAISGILGAYLVLYPKSRIKVLVFFITSFYVPAIVFLGIWIVQQFFSGAASLVQTADTGGVAWWAHIGGAIVGIIAGFYFRKTAPPRPLAGKYA